MDIGRSGRTWDAKGGGAQRQAGQYIPGPLGLTVRCECDSRELPKGRWRAGACGRSSDWLIVSVGSSVGSGLYVAWVLGCLAAWRS